MKYGNVAGLKSSGVELTLSTRNIETKNFSWSTDFIYSHLKEEVTDLMSYKRAIDLVWKAILRVRSSRSTSKA